MPIVLTEAQEKAAAAARAKEERREARKEAREVRTSAPTEKDATPIPENKMLGLPDTVKVGDLELVLTCPKIKNALRIQNDIYTSWPDVIIFAATAEPLGTGINPEAVCALWNAQRRAVAKMQDLAEPEPITVKVIRGLQGELFQSLGTILPPLCGTIWELASATPSLHWPRIKEKTIAIQLDEDGTETEQEIERDIELPDGDKWLDDALMESLSVPELADLLRAMLACMGGYPGDAAERFP